MPYIDVVPPERAEGMLKEVYADAAGRRGVVANVLQIHSLKPETLTTHLDFYMSVLYGRSGLSRQEREAIAVAVSHANRCRYCVEHHADAYARYEKDQALVSAMRESGRADGLSMREQALVEFATSLTAEPWADSEGRVGRLREAGFDDEEILTAALTVGYFNFVNRVVTGLGVELESDVHDAAYKY